MAWSKNHAWCRDCGGIQLPHRAHGLCVRCYDRWYYQCKPWAAARKKQKALSNYEAIVLRTKRFLQAHPDRNRLYQSLHHARKRANLTPVMLPSGSIITLLISATEQGVAA